MRQRQLKREGRLSAERIQRLDALGFEWGAPATPRVDPTPPAASWDEMFASLVEFEKRFGHCKVLRGWPEHPHLAAWLRSQRQFRRQGRLSADRIRRLDHFGFEWEPRATAWEDMFATLVQFKEHFGHCNVPLGWPEDPHLAAWVRSQRQLRREGRLSVDRIRRLDALGFEGGAPAPPAASWDKMFSRLVEFKKRFGHCKVPFGWPEDPQLVQWANLQRHLRLHAYLSAERIQRLDALGFEWDLLAAARQRSV
jgi:hypothetical protein